MEGLAGVVSASEVNSTGPDYAHFRVIMAAETNAAIDGAMRAGATSVVVRDSHGSKQNLLPNDVDPRARLLRGVSTGPRNMMEGIDSTFDAVVFIGYHAKAGTPNAILEHTSTGNVIDFSINGVSLPEGGYNALHRLAFRQSRRRTKSGRVWNRPCGTARVRRLIKWPGRTPWCSR